MDLNLVIMNRSATGVVTKQYELHNATLESATWELNGPGEANFKMSAYDDVVRYLTSWNHELQVWVDGELLWWGPLWTKRGTPGQVEWKCEGLLSLLTKRFITTTSADFDSVDQGEIAWGIWNYAQEPQGSENDFKGLGITQHTSYPDTGVNRSRRYERYEHRNLLTLLEEFPGLDDGFDYDIELDPAAGRRDFQIYHPTKGVYHPNYIMEFGRNISDYTLEESSEDEANDVYATGGSAGDVRFESHLTFDPRESVRGMMTDVYSEGSMLDVDWLEAKCWRRLKKRMHPPKTLSFSAFDITDKMVNVPMEMLGEINTGDRLPVYIDDGANDFDGFVRVEKVIFKPDDETLGLEVSVITVPEDDPVLVAAGVA